MVPQREIYLDNAATTRPGSSVVAAMVAALSEGYGNPSSIHGKGLAAEQVVSAARAQVAAAIGVPPAWVVFTSGGTEANNLAIKGAARAYSRRGRHLIGTAVEHSSVLETLRSLEADGFALTLVPVDRRGRVDPAAVTAALRPETVLLSVMAVNNEVGTIQPVAEIAQAVSARRGRGRLPLLHVDAVQAFGRVSIPTAQIDLLTISAHKVHGPKGVGALIVREGVRIEPLLHGGDQQRALRPGTENVPGIVGFGEAAARIQAGGEEGAAALRSLRAHLADRLALIEGVSINGPDQDDLAAPHILNVSLAGVRGETLVHRLEVDGIYVSTGSACHSRDPRPSHVLLAMGLDREAALSSVRISLARSTTIEEIDDAADAIARAVGELRVLV
ncbi:MAG TPA: cysteine desulfurase family protein [bacterium]|jgi:cysteine desulfurase|nr:cysteine desulfurase family protein [bacterium]